MHPENPQPEPKDLNLNGIFEETEKIPDPVRPDTDHPSFSKRGVTKKKFDFKKAKAHRKMAKATKKAQRKGR